MKMTLEPNVDEWHGLQHSGTVHHGEQARIPRKGVRPPRGGLAPATFGCCGPSRVWCKETDDPFALGR